jgi:alcohol dehydrogenase class IV
VQTSELLLRKFLAPEFVFGVGARHLAGRYTRNLGVARALVVTDPGVVAAGWTAQVVESLEAGGVRTTLFAGVSANPRAAEVAAGSEAYRAAACTGIVAVGGGSPIDCAKGIGIEVSNGRGVLAFEGVDRVARPMPPLVCVPTTAGTSADVSQFAIITDSARRVKIAIVSKAVVPDLALVDPETLVSLDPYLTACTGLDALVHAIEAYVSNASSAMSDVHALEAIRLLAGNLPGSIAAPADLALRTAVMQGSLHAGLAFSNASLGAVHAGAHSLGGWLDLPHGECNALLLPHVIGFNFAAAPERYRRIAELLSDEPVPAGGGREAAAAVVARVDSLRVAAGVRGSLGERGVRRDDVAALAENALRDACMVTNPRRPNLRDVEVIYEEAL